MPEAVLVESSIVEGRVSGFCCLKPRRLRRAMVCADPVETSLQMNG